MGCFVVIVVSRRAAFTRKHIFHVCIENMLKLDKNLQNTESKIG